MDSPLVFDVTARDFEQSVVAASADVPVLLDFWAEWCGPCKALGPVLERLVDEYGGAFRLGKVDTEVEQDLAYAFQVRNIPFCVLIVGGRPVDAFAGALPERDVRQFLARFGVEPKPVEPAEELDPDSAAGRLRDGRAAAARGDVRVARERLEGIPEEDDLHARARHLLDGLAFLEAEVDSGDGAAAEHIAVGRERFAAGDHRAAAEALLESVAIARGYRDGLARRGLVLCFELMDDSAHADTVREYRRRLATLLY